MSIRKLLAPVTLAALMAAGLSIAVRAQQQGPIGTTAGVEASALAQDETPELWFVELTGAPVADGGNRSTLKAEKAAFRNAAGKAGIRFAERFAFEDLWNGLSIRINPSQLGRLSRMAGVKAIYPVIEIAAPRPDELDPTPDLATAITMTGADVAQTQLGVTGQGVKVGIIDTGLDIDHPAFGGNGADDSTPFPTARVVAGWDFVGDAFVNSSSTPVPDDNPDDCGGHGTHVAGIVGANGTVKGVAPGVKFGAYRVFGCSGSTTADIMIKAMERALADGMNIVNMSIGSAYQWPQYPSAAAATRMVNRGMVVVASIGNDGEKSLAAAGAPGVGTKVIGVASFDNRTRSIRYFTIGDSKYTFTPVTGAPMPPTAGTYPLVRTGTQTSAADACTALPAGSLTGAVALVRRGTCSFYIKASNAQAAGAVAVILYNNVAAAVSPTVAGTPAIAIPVVYVPQGTGNALDSLIASGSQMLTWTADVRDFLSSFSSYGLSPTLDLKPDIGAPGGSIYSTYPLEKGGFATMSGTSMSSPHVAGTAALYLEAHPHTPSQAMRAILQNTAEPKFWSGNPMLGLLDLASRQGAGMVQIDKAIQATVKIEPGKLSLGEGQAGPRYVSLSLENNGADAVTYGLSFENGVSAVNGPPVTYTYSDGSTGTYYRTDIFTGNAAVAFDAPTVTVPAHGTAVVNATITPATSPLKGHYGGYLVFEPLGAGATLRVPYAGFIGDYQSIQVLTNIYSSAYPRLVKDGAMASDGASFTMIGSDVPTLRVHFDYQSRLVKMEVFDAVTGKAWHQALKLEYFGRNSANSYYSLPFDGTTESPSNKKVYTVPNGSYVIKLSVLQALGNEANPADWEVWTSPMFYISR